VRLALEQDLKLKEQVYIFHRGFFEKKFLNRNWRVSADHPQTIFPSLEGRG
jgi:hypothetical protein